MKVPPPPPKSSNPGASIDMSLWLTCCTSLCLKPSPWLSEKAKRELGWLPSGCHKIAIGGFTLAELLICIAILGVIATFTIPKIMAGQQNQRFNSAAKELATTLSALYVNAYTENGGEQWVQANGVDQNYLITGGKFNYVKRISGVNMTPPPAGLSAVRNSDTFCNSNPAWVSCYLLHNGGVLWYHRISINNFGAWYFHFDPDSTGPAESVTFMVYTSNAVTTYNPSGNIQPGRLVTPPELPGGYGTLWFVGANPSWFSW